jgi:transcriptional regulator with XRE-family HTH domain
MNAGYDATIIAATKKAREKTGVSIPEIARLLKMTPEAYARYEEDTRMKRIIVVKFFVFLDIDTYKLYCSAR